MYSNYCFLVSLCLSVLTFYQINVHSSEIETDLTETGSSNQVFGIVGGQEVPIEKVKYIATVLDDEDSPLGAATILNNKWLVTTASFATEKPTMVRVGSRYSNEEGTRYTIDSFIAHPDYDGDRKDDIALIKTKDRITFSSTVWPIAIRIFLPPKNNDIAYLTGFGYINNITEGSILKGVNQFYMDFLTCKEHYCESSFTQNSFCTYLSKDGPCNYDWGSPLVYRNRLLGILSTIYGCTQEHTTDPPVYTDVTKYRDWIRTTMRLHRTSSLKKGDYEIL